MRFSSCVVSGPGFAAIDLSRSVFIDCDLSDVDFSGAVLEECRFQACDLSGANWKGVHVGGATLQDCTIYGMNLWGTQGEIDGARSLTVSVPDGPTIEVDGLHIAVFISSLLGGGGVRELVDGLTSTVVLILGRFAPGHKTVLDDVRTVLRAMGYSAIVFDTGMPRSRDTTETIQVLARLARFVIADATAPQAVPFELQQFVSDCAVPLQVVTRGERAFTMVHDLEKYPWVRPAKRFCDEAALLDDLPELVAGLEAARQAGGATT